MTAPAAGGAADPRAPGFYDRSVVEVARALVGCLLAHEGALGRIVETEAYHEDEPACHAHTGLTTRTRTLFEAPGRAYVYRSYGIHALLNAVVEEAGVGAAVLIRALEPVESLERMRARRGLEHRRALCSGPGKLTHARGVDAGESAAHRAPEVPEIGPAPVLALVVGVFHAGLYLLIRGSAGVQLPFVLVAAVLGAFGGQAVGSRVGDPLLIGDFGLLWASLLSWLGILVVAAAGVLAPSRDRL